MHKTLIYSFILCALVFKVSTAQDYTIRDVQINSNGETHKYRNLMQTDGDGFLWYSTHNGLVKDFGAYNVLSPFSDETPDDLPKYIHGFFIDSKQRIWISATTGIFISSESLYNNFNRIEFKPFLKGLELQANSFMEDCEGNLWIVAGDSMENIMLKVDSSLAITKYRIPRIGPRYVDASYFLGGFLHFERRIGCDKFLARRGRKLFVLDKGNTSLIADFTATLNYDHSSYYHPEWQQNGGDGLLITDNGDIFPESTETEYTYKGEIFKTHFIEDFGIQVINLPLQEMIPITEDANPTLKNYADLIGIDDFGKKLSLYKIVDINGSLHLKRTYEIPFPNLIDDVLIERNDIIYITSHDQIHKIKFNKNSFDRILYRNGGQNIDSRGFLELPNKEILAATDEGVFKLSPTESNNYGESPYNATCVFPKLNLLRSFLKASDSTAWCIGEHKALWKINFRKNTIVDTNIFHSHRRLANLHYYDILKHSDSTLLLASNYDLQEFNFRQKKFRVLPIPPMENAEDPITRDLHKTKDKLYIGTDINGLIIQDLDSNTFLHLTKDSTNNGLTLPTNTIYTTLLDQHENIWLGTDKGAIHIDKDLKNATIIGAADGFTDLNVVGILEDADENMWFSTHDGLYRYEKDLKKVTAFYVEDGLPFNDFNPYGYYKTSTNTLLFGGVRGLIAFDSIDGSVRSRDIRIFPTKFEYYDSTREMDVELDALNAKRYDFDLPYSKNSFSISYSINDCYNTETNKYTYKLDGFTEDWVNLGDQTTLKLLSIPPGDYVLRVKGLDGTGLESSNELNYDIHVAQVFYKRSWIQAVAVLFLLSLVALALYYHSVRERKKHQVRFTLVELERKTLRAQMNPHFIFNALKGIRKTVKEGKLSRLDDYITSFSSLMRLTLDLTRNENILLSKEIQYIENYVALTNTKSKHKIDLIVQCGSDIDIKDIFIPSMVLQPIVENSIVHGFTDDQREKSITIKIERSKATKQLVLTIEDNGIGVSGSKSKDNTDKWHQSYATQILRERLKLLNQIRKREFGYEITTKDIGDGVRTGTQVTIKIPY